jgi:hypothetical protein
MPVAIQMRTKHLMTILMTTKISHISPHPYTLKNEKNIPLLPRPALRKQAKNPKTTMPYPQKATHRLYCLYGENQTLTVDIYGVADLIDWYKKLSLARIRTLTLSVLNP